MMMPYSFVYLLLLFLTVSSQVQPQDRWLKGGGPPRRRRGCPKSWKRLRSQYYRNRDKWEEEAPSTTCYNMTIQATCFCVDTYRQPHYLVVRNGEIQNSSVGEYAAEMPTVDGLFRRLYNSCLRNCPRSGAAECKVKFNKDYGYITSIYIDQSELIADEEINYTVSELTFCED
jgi:hypothetical protein